MHKHCCQSLITEDHTDYCLSRQEKIVQLQAEAERVRGQRATLRALLRIRRHNGEPWAVGFARRDWPRVAEILGVAIEAVEWCPDCGYAHRPEPCAGPAGAAEGRGDERHRDHHRA
jgi:hypothetical protein